MPKRVGNLIDKICDIKNIEFADYLARRGKKCRKVIIRHDEHREEENKRISEMLRNGTWKPSPYKEDTITEPCGNTIKTRNLKKSPYYPDRIVHCALMNVLVPIWDKTFVSHSFSCIKGRGIHACIKYLQKILREHPEETKYCLKIDIRKYFESINHEVLINIISRNIKDKVVLHAL